MEPVPQRHRRSPRRAAPTFVHIPTDLLVKIAPDRAYVVGINFRFNNMFDNSAAHNDIGYRYTIPLLEGARRTIAYQEARGPFENSDEDKQYDRIIAAWDKLGQEMANVLAQA